MSHLEERKEKNCLNCNAQVQGKYCHICGQENIEPEESAWHLVSHFFQDITHFDGKFFSSLKLLIFRPGFLSREYMIGRRASYLNPIRMYVFTSAIFFLIFFSILKPADRSFNQTIDINGETLEQISRMDSAKFAKFTRTINVNDHKKDTPMSRAQFKEYIDTMSFGNFELVGMKYKSTAAYDSALQSGTIDDGWFKRTFIHKILYLNDKYRNKKEEAMKDFKETFLHSIPQMLFVSLPLLALLFKLLYIRRKHFYYVSHGIFCIHLFIFIFINLLVLTGLEKINNSLHWGFISFVQVIMTLGIFFYWYKAMRNFYQQRRGKTILKFILVQLLFFIVLSVVLVAFVLFSILKL